MMSRFSSGSSARSSKIIVSFLVVGAVLVGGLGPVRGLMGLYR